MDRLAWLQRPTAILLTLFLIETLPARTVDLVAVGILFAHYLAAIQFYPWGAVRNSGRLRSQLAITAGAALVSWLLFRYSYPSIILYFGVHFVLTELYEGQVSKEPVPVWVGRTIYYGSCYLLLMRMHLGVENFSLPLIAASVLGLASIALSRPGWRSFFSEASFLGILAVAYPYNMRFSYVLIYHVALWWAIPLVRSYRIEASRYLKISLFTTVAFLLVVLGSTAWRAELYGWWIIAVTLFGYLHVTLSFVMSNLNPPLLRELTNNLQRRLADVL